MSVLRLEPARLGGALPAIPSKSDAHRLLLAAALADCPTTLRLPQSSQDIEATLRCLSALGAAVSCDGAQRTVTPIPRPLPPGRPPLDCFESGSTLRFLLPVAAALANGSSVTFVAQGRLAERPMGPLRDCLAANGTVFSSPEGDWPLTLSGRLSGGVFSLPGDVSSQYISGLLFALPLLEGDSAIRLTSPLESGGYVDMTLSTLRRFGVAVEEAERGYRLPGGQRYRAPGPLEAEGDWSNAAFFLAAGALGGPVTVTGLAAGSLQRDRAVLPLLERFGAKVTQRGDAVTVTSPAALSPLAVSVRDIPDLVPALAVVAAFAKGHSVFSDAGRLRLKESDRLQSVAALVSGLGGRATVEGDALHVWGSPVLPGGQVDSAADHRIAMAAAVAATRCIGGVALTNPEAVAKSYPGFFRDYISLGGVVHGF